MGTVSGSALKELPFFSALSDAELATASPLVKFRTYPRRALIISAGSRIEGLYVIVSGRVKVLREDERGRQIIVEEFAQHDVFGEIGLLQEELSSAVVEAQIACELICVPRKFALECIERNPAAAMFILGVLSRRLSHAHDKIAGLALTTVHTRVANVLLQRGRDESGQWLVEVGSESIAAMVGASREMVSRVVRNLIDRGIARRQKRKIVVLDRALLAQCVARSSTAGEQDQLALAPTSLSSDEARLSVAPPP
jgi:CRP-like cAMP-binding protein